MRFLNLRNTVRGALVVALLWPTHANASPAFAYGPPAGLLIRVTEQSLAPVPPFFRVADFLTKASGLFQTRRRLAHLTLSGVAIAIVSVGIMNLWKKAHPHTPTPIRAPANTGDAEDLSKLSLFHQDAVRLRRAAQNILDKGYFRRIPRSPEIYLTAEDSEQGLRYFIERMNLNVLQPLDYLEPEDGALMSVAINPETGKIMIHAQQAHIDAISEIPEALAHEAGAHLAPREQRRMRQMTIEAASLVKRLRPYLSFDGGGIARRFTPKRIAEVRAGKTAYAKEILQSILSYGLYDSDCLLRDPSLRAPMLRVLSQTAAIEFVAYYSGFAVLEEATGMPVSQWAAAQLSLIRGPMSFDEIANYLYRRQYRQFSDSPYGPDLFKPTVEDIRKFSPVDRTAARIWLMGKHFKAGTTLPRPYMEDFVKFAIVNSPQNGKIVEALARASGFPNFRARTMEFLPPDEQKRFIDWFIETVLMPGLREGALSPKAARQSPRAVLNNS